MFDIRCLSRSAWLTRRPGLLHIIARSLCDEAIKQWMEDLPLAHDAGAFPEQLHTASLSETDGPGLFFGVDGLWSKERQLLVVRTADCIPIVVWDPTSGLKAVVHAGRKGIALGIVEATVRTLQHAGADPRRLFAYTGPHIQGCCYRFPMTNPEAERIGWAARDGACIEGGVLVLDLSKEARAHFLRSGLIEERIVVDGRCTCCHPSRLPSHRREGLHRRRVLLTLSFAFHMTEEDQMGIDPELLKILACPETKEPVSLASDAMIEKLNTLVTDGKVKNRGGDPVKETMDAGLVREDGRFLYPIRDEIPIMLIEEAIELPPLELAP